MSVNISRRTFCIGLGGCVLGPSTGPVGATTDADDAMATVSTRDHYDVDGSGVNLATGVESEEYDTNGRVPGIKDQCAQDLTVSIHGFRADEQHAIDGARDVRQGLTANGYDGAVVNFSWDADYPFWLYDETEAIARRNGEKLAAFTREYLSRCQDGSVRFVAHSMGAQVALSALESLARTASGTEVTAVALLGPAVEASQASLDGRYGHAVQSQAGRLDNFRKPEDTVLNWAFRSVNGRSALGASGIGGPAPDNYHETAVPGVPSHSEYRDPEDGVLDRVAASW